MCLSCPDMTIEAQRISRADNSIKQLPKVVGKLNETNLCLQKLVDVSSSFTLIAWKVVTGALLVGGLLEWNLPFAGLMVILMVPASVLHTIKRQNHP